MAVDTLPKVEAVTLSIRVPKELKDRFDDAAKLISEITPKKPVNPEDLMSFTLFKETTGNIVIEFLEWVQNCDESLFSDNGSGRSQPLPRQRSNDE
jgi:hypothetical protein